MPSSSRPQVQEEQACWGEGKPTRIVPLSHVVRISYDTVKVSEYDVFGLRAAKGWGGRGEEDFEGLCANTIVSSILY